MSQTVYLQGATYTQVPSIVVPTSASGGTASFYDVSDTTATASDVASGSYFYASDGTYTAGTASGGSSWTLLGSSSFTVSTTSTQASSVGTIACGSSAFTDAQIIYVRVRDNAGKRAGYFYGSDAFFFNYQAANGSTSTLTYAARSILSYTSSSAWYQYTAATTGGYGVYGYSINSSGTVTIRRRYNSTYSLTINGTYTVEVYALDYPDGISPFDA